MSEKNIDAFAARLGDSGLGTVSELSLCSRYSPWWKKVFLVPLLIPSPDVKQKLNVATELRDNVEQLCSGPTYPLFLKKLIPVFKKLLEGSPVFTSTSWEHVS